MVDDGERVLQNTSAGERNATSAQRWRESLLISSASANVAGMRGGPDNK